jgi:hypothetical protein
MGTNSKSADTTRKVSWEPRALAKEHPAVPVRERAGIHRRVVGIPRQPVESAADQIRKNAPKKAAVGQPIVG